jgi:serine/threonine protein kinase/WD40 repeat protein
MPMNREDENPTLDGDESGASALEDLLAAYVNRINAGEQVQPEEILFDHPARGPEILEQLEAFIGTGAGSGSQTSIGTLGDYTLRRQIGRGGMGVVYEAWQGSLDRRVALKVLPAGIAADNRAFLRFMKEAKTAAQLNHRNVVAVYGMGVEQNTPYFAMELVEGETLAQILLRLKEPRAEGSETPFGKKDSIAYFGKLAEAFADVADGLQHAHSKKVTHRDIKPSNLILDHEGRLRILDFGLARLEGQESLTISGDLLGTPLYMSPEQVRRKKIAIDHRTDIYSLGVTLYEMLTHQPPFRGKDHADTLSQIIERDPSPPSRINARVPRDLETIVLKCLRKEPGDRYGTAEALGQDLRRFVRGEPVEARVEGQIDRLARWLRRHRLSLEISAAIGLIALVSLTVGLALITRAHEMAISERDTRSRDLYISDMRLALKDWQAGELGRFESLLNRHQPMPDRPDLRGWEWYYLKSLLRAKLIRTMDVDSNGVLAVRWQPRGLHMLTASQDDMLRIWDDSGKAVLEIKVPELSSAVAWDPRGERLAIMTVDSKLHVFGALEEKELFAVPIGHLDTELKDVSFCIAWNPAGDLIGVAVKLVGADRSRGSMVVCRADDGAVLQDLDVGDARGVLGVDWSPDGELLGAAIEVPGTVILWNVETWEETSRFRPFPGDWLTSLAWSPDRSCLAISRCPGGRGETVIWDLDRGQARAHFEGGSSCLAWSPRGMRLASAGWDGSVVVWDGFQSGEGVSTRTIHAHANSVSSLAWSPDGERLTTASEDGRVKVWDARRTEARKLDQPAIWSPDGRSLCATTSKGRTVQVLEALTNQVRWVKDCEAPVVQVTFRPTDGGLIALSLRGDVVQVWDWVADQQVFRIDKKHGDGIWSPMAWKPDASFLLTGNRDGVLRIWDTWSWALVNEIAAHAAAIVSVAWSPDGSRLSTTGADLGLKIWDTATWRVTRELVRARRTPTARWEATTGSALAFSPSGDRLAAGVLKGAPKGFVVFDVATGREIFRGQAQSTGVSAVAWNPLGDRLATVGPDRTVKIWNALTGEELIAVGMADLVSDGPSLAWHPDGLRLLAAGAGWKILDASSAFAEFGSH